MRRILTTGEMVLEEVASSSKSMRSQFSERLFGQNGVDIDAHLSETADHGLVAEAGCWVSDYS